MLNVLSSTGSTPQPFEFAGAHLEFGDTDTHCRPKEITGAAATLCRIREQFSVSSIVGINRAYEAGY